MGFLQSGRLIYWHVYCNSSSCPTSSENLICNASLNIDICAAHSAMFCLYKDQTKKKWFCCFIWSGAAYSTLFIIERVQNSSCEIWIILYTKTIFTIDETLLASRYSTAVFRDDVQMDYIPWLHQSLPSQLEPASPRRRNRLITIPLIFHWWEGTWDTARKFSSNSPTKPGLMLINIFEGMSVHRFCLYLSLQVKINSCFWR